MSRLAALVRQVAAAVHLEWPHSNIKTRVATLQPAGLSEGWYSLLPVCSWRGRGEGPSQGGRGVVWATVSLDFWRRAEAAVPAGARRGKARLEARLARRVTSDLRQLHPTFREALPNPPRLDLRLDEWRGPAWPSVALHGPAAASTS